MAESAAESDQINAGTMRERLRYLGFVHVAAIQGLVCLSRLYDLAKESSGPLRPGVQAVEGTVRAVVGPIYEKLHGVPLEILKFVDRKVGGAVDEAERHVPSLVKEAPGVARSISDEVQRAGVVGTAGELAKAAYRKYEPVAERYPVTAWRALNRLPVFPQVAEIVVPTAAYCAEKYNGAVRGSVGKGYAFAGYLPLVPDGEEEALAVTECALRHQFGLDHTLTTGVISGLRRDISSAATGRPIHDVIQTDAAINPGNSGGPLLDISSGSLIGINTAIYSPSGASSGVGFSIPVDTVGGIVDQLVQFGKVTRPILGIKFAPDQSVEQLGLTGVLVLDAPPYGPAGKAKIPDFKLGLTNEET